MDVILAIFKYIIDMGASVMMPIILTIVATIMGAKFSNALRAGMTFGVGFIGLNAVIGILSGTISPVAEKLVENLNFPLSTIDIGWPAGSALAWSTEIVPVIFIVVLLTNIVMLAAGLTKTMDIDIWNYWHCLFTASLIVLVTGSWIAAILSAIVNMALVFILADYCQKDCAEVLGLEGISLPHIQTTCWVIIDYPLNWLLDKIPGIKDINWTAEGIADKLGLLGEPIMLGFIIGAVLSAMAEFSGGATPLAGIQQMCITGMNVAAVLVLIPRMVSLLMEGLMPISEQAQEFIEKRFPGKEVYIGLDSAIATGHPFVVSVALIMIPVSLGIAVLLSNIIPGYSTLPLTDLSAWPFYVIFTIVPNKGNLFRGILLGIVNVTITLLFANYAAQYFTALAGQVGLDIPQGATQVTCLAVGAQWYTWIPFILAKTLLGSQM